MVRAYSSSTKLNFVQLIFKFFRKLKERASLTKYKRMHSFTFSYNTCCHLSIFLLILFFYEKKNLQEKVIKKQNKKRTWIWLSVAIWPRRRCSIPCFNLECISALLFTIEHDFCEYLTALQIDFEKFFTLVTWRIDDVIVHLLNVIKTYFI